MDKTSMERLREASAAEAEAANSAWHAVRATSGSPEETSFSDENSQAAETVSDGSDIEGDVCLHPGTIISTLLRPHHWKAPTNRRFFLDYYEVGELCYAA